MLALGALIVMSHGRARTVTYVRFCAHCRHPAPSNNNQKIEPRQRAAKTICRPPLLTLPSQLLPVTGTSNFGRRRRSRDGSLPTPKTRRRTAQAPKLQNLSYPGHSRSSVSCRPASSPPFSRNNTTSASGASATLCVMRISVVRSR